MMKFKSIILSFMAICLMIPNVITPVSAATSEVKVSIPKFAVEVNGKKIDNLHALYPILTYKEITYFPMTLNYAKSLGLSVQWNNKNGLSIQSLASRTPMKADKLGNNSLTKTYKAQIAAFPVQVNGQKINNTTEKYPLLVFHDITYFPMTWHFTNDLFGWSTEWNSISGYHIRGTQNPVLSDIFYDDASFLYVRSGTESIYKISKALDGKYTLLSEQENDTIMEKVQVNDEKNAAPQAVSTDGTVSLKGDNIYYKEQAIIPLESYLKKIEESKKTDSETVSGIDYNANFTKLDDANSLLSVTVLYLNHIPAPYTPHEKFEFVIHNDKASKVEGYTQWVEKLIKNQDGSFWISSSAPLKHDLDTSNFDRIAQLALIDKDGLSYNINQQLKVQDIDVLYADNQSLLIKAYNDRLAPTRPIKIDGFYSIDTQLKATKMADSIPGIGYVDINKQIFVLNPDNNTITNVTTKKSHKWWDYELRTDL
ncbi:hypothetical protein EHS13_31315 [Paenibacillus psychroresistens]|uniref:Copper amine oxidase-like N-terminal domain-containing protein n=1 Tax=Paenibacillus psychroresistens TaxID=1778678 RepID=A0A6B8RT08_9BACL|nr:hypothetical protein [Paenibacillus psychroresistens]QGQ99049.1 hypothetical protein EHS13_31315 [Paenibacillus psychroresistens]